MLEINKIHLGDSYELIKQIPDNSIDCIYTDIPYLYEQGGAGKSDIAKRCAKQKMSLQGTIELFDNNKSNQENLRIAKNKINSNTDLIRNDITKGIDLELFIEQCFRVMKKPNIFIWCSRMQLLEVMTLLERKIGRVPEILVWVKDNPIPATNNLWLSDIEYCVYARKDVRLNDGYHLKSKWYNSPINQKDKSKYEHPTIKPLNLVERHLLHTTQENDVVLDMFSGSGTTCKACKNINRQFIGIEIEPKWHQISVDRLNNIEADGTQSLF